MKLSVKTPKVPSYLSFFCVKSIVVFRNNNSGGFISAFRHNCSCSVKRLHEFRMKHEDFPQDSHNPTR